MIAALDVLSQLLYFRLIYLVGGLQFWLHISLNNKDCDIMLANLKSQSSGSNMSKKRDSVVSEVKNQRLGTHSSPFRWL